MTPFPKYTKYRDSGVEWLGEVPQHWEVEKGLRYFFETESRSVTGDEELLSVSHLTGVTPRSEKNITMFMAESYEGSKLCEVGDIAINTMWAWMAALGVSRYRGLVSPSYGTYRQKKPERFPRSPHPHGCVSLALHGEFDRHHHESASFVSTFVPAAEVRLPTPRRTRPHRRLPG
jgi:hypothetical protein